MAVWEPRVRKLLNCRTCAPSLQTRLGCHGPAERPVRLNGVPEFPRCPLAMQREADGHIVQWVHWSQVWYLAQRTGNLGVYWRNPSPVSIEVLTILGHHYLERAAQEQQEA